MLIAGRTRAGWKIRDSVVQLLHLLVKDSGLEISPSGSHALSRQVAKLASLGRLSSKYNALCIAEPVRRMCMKVRHGTAELDLCYIQKALTSGAKAQR